MKRKLGIFLMWIGVLAILGAAGLMVYNHQEDRCAGEASARVIPKMEKIILQRREDSQKENSSAEEQTTQQVTLQMPAEEIDGCRYVGCLSMPTIHRELPVRAEFRMSYLQEAPCRYHGSAYTDDLVLAAHNYDRHFGPISNLQPGDAVYFTDMNGIVNTYQVASTETLMPTDVDKVVSGEADLTLFTCNYSGARRVAVRCVRKTAS